ncbi:MAG: FliH/SctL family protein [Terracidiphilus sp.]|nr:FliH/SctL family protein [Terracidiphilus sp.]
MTIKDSSVATHAFDYEECASDPAVSWSGFTWMGPDAEVKPAPTSDGAVLQKKEDVAEEAKRHFESGRCQGIEEGRRAERESIASVRGLEQAQRREQIATALQRLHEDREHYLHAVESEVVSLALAVAARILRRESQLDPLLLTGAVRVALGQLSGSTEVHLHVPLSEFELWKEAIAHVPNLTVRPQVEPDEHLVTGECIVKTTVGTVDLGIKAQLSEIERGFFDQVGRKRATAKETVPQIEEEQG